MYGLVSFNFATNEDEQRTLGIAVSLGGEFRSMTATAPVECPAPSFVDDRTIQAELRLSRCAPSCDRSVHNAVRSKEWTFSRSESASVWNCWRRV